MTGIPHPASQLRPIRHAAAAEQMPGWALKAATSHVRLCPVAPASTAQMACNSVYCLVYLDMKQNVGIREDWAGSKDFDLRRQDRQEAAVHHQPTRPWSIIACAGTAQLVLSCPTSREHNAGLKPLVKFWCPENVSWTMCMTQQLTR